MLKFNKWQRAWKREYLLASSHLDNIIKQREVQSLQCRVCRCEHFVYPVAVHFRTLRNMVPQLSFQCHGFV